jgi:hypothetical protein
VFRLTFGEADVDGFVNEAQTGSLSGPILYRLAAPGEWWRYGEASNNNDMAIDDQDGTHDQTRKQLIISPRGSDRIKIMSVSDADSTTSFSN